MVKVRVLDVDLAHRRLKLTLASKKVSEAEERAERQAAPSGDPWGGVAPGQRVDATITQVRPGRVLFVCGTVDAAV